MGFGQLDLVLVRSIATLVVVLAVTLSGWWPAASSSAAEMPVGATLKVLALPVEVEVAQTQTFVAAIDGQMLGQGDVVRTGPGGLALLTFFDGSETQLGAESTVQIERAEATPAPQIALLQTAGVTMNHVVPMAPGGSFQTDTPAATGLVRGTSYVVVVGDSASTSPAAGASAPQTPPSCGLSGEKSCTTSVILLTDRDGHVGRVDVAPSASRTAGSGNSTPPVWLTRAGDAAGSDGTQTSAAHVAAARLQALEAGANARAVPDAVRDAERHAHVVATALAGGNARADGQEALEPAAVADPSDRFEDTGRSDRPKSSEQRPVVPASVSVATDVSGTTPKNKDSQSQTGQSVQSGQAAKSDKPAAPVSRTVPAPVPAVTVPAASTVKSDKLAKPANQINP